MSTGRNFGCVTAVCLLAIAGNAAAQDWPQWRGPNRDAKASGFRAPASWPAQLTQKWKVTAGSGVSTPAVVGNRVYVFTRQDDNEVLSCLNAESGDEVWQGKYSVGPFRGRGDAGYSGPRTSPAVAEGRVVTLGVTGVLCCFDAATGKELWRNNEFENETPTFHTGSSPIVVNGLCIAQLGGERNGGIYAFDLATGDERWNWTEDGPEYGSPVLMTIDNAQLVVAPTNENLVALSMDGKEVWQLPYEQGGRYTSATPIVHGDMLIVAGPGSGVSAFRLKKQGDTIVEEKLWSNTDNSLVFNTPVLKSNLLVGISSAGQLFCIDIENPESTAWSAPVSRAAGEAAARGAENNRRNRVRAFYVQVTQQEDRQRQDRGERPGAGEGRRRGEGRGEGRGRFGGERGRGGRGGRGGGGYGSVVDAGSVLLALSPAGELVVFRPNSEEFSEIARYRVAEPEAGRSEEGAFAYPVAVGNSIYIKDRDTLTRWDVR